MNALEQITAAQARLKALPELPVEEWNGPNGRLYSAEQMREYALQALRDESGEAVAKVAQKDCPKCTQAPYQRDAVYRECLCGQYAATGGYTPAAEAAPLTTAAALDEWRRETRERLTNIVNVLERRIEELSADPHGGVFEGLHKLADDMMIESCGDDPDYAVWGPVMGVQMHTFVSRLRRLAYALPQVPEPKVVPYGSDSGVKDYAYGYEKGYSDGWNGCRAAMLAAAPAQGVR